VSKLLDEAIKGGEGFDCEHVCTTTKPVYNPHKATTNHYIIFLICMLILFKILFIN